MSTAIARTRIQSAGSIVPLTRKEQNRYSISQAILAAEQRALGKRFNNFETDVSEQIALTIPGNIVRRGGVLIPTGIEFQRAGLDSGATTKGRELAFTSAGTFIDALRTRAVVLAMGATMLVGLRDNLAFPRETAGATGVWVGENTGADAADSNLTLDQVPAIPKTLIATTSFSRQLLVQATPAVDQIVVNDFAAVSALSLDRAALHGGGGVEPLGLYNLPGPVNPVTMGGAITFAKVVDMETAVATVNGETDQLSSGYVTSPEIRGKAKLVPELAGGSVRMWCDGQMNDRRAEATNQIRKDLGVGVNEHGIVYGIWSECIFCEWGATEIIVDPFRLKKTGMIEVTSFLLANIVFKHAASFSKGTGLTTA